MPSSRRRCGRPLKLRNAITSRFKIVTSLDIAERRLPQDERIKLKIGTNKEMDFRVSVLPTLFGEKIVNAAPGEMPLDLALADVDCPHCD